ncbi:tRNA pseudouridine(38-40) synthase TruA [Blattabacterium cuenoti]|uniref:tRNA pseudouridine(38-40) synthase TruA n=1 Tax=Blattabacterium cuenoti TaxID=1653831 RepID=UPI00163B8E00|nr:tRNA pseudouridine(38-40) synthase TruA [Blattabacterium cuenoti]
MRFFIELSYNGKDFFGWQIQKGLKTIEESIEYCLSKILHNPINLIGAGRTDKGVHAKQMFAHFDYSYNIEYNLIIKRLNIFLPNSIKVINIFPVKNNIHARFNAIKRTYKYYITYDKNPFKENFYWHCFYLLDIEKMNIVSKKLLLYKDFSSFCKKNVKNNNHKINNNCHIYRAFWKKEKNYFYFTIESNRFLRSMVRSIVGTMIDVGRGKITINNFIKIIKSKNFNHHSQIAPSYGLFLTNITYPEDIFL